MRILGKKRSEQWYKIQEEINRDLEKETTERLRANKEFINSLSPEKLRQYRIMKIVFIFFMLSFYFVSLLTYSMGWRTLLSTLLVELGITLISVVFWRDPPKNVTFPRIFAMPVLAFVLTLVGLGGFFLCDVLGGKFSAKAQLSTENAVHDNGSDFFEDSSQQEESEYELWLREKNIIDVEDIQGGQ